MFCPLSLRAVVLRRRQVRAQAMGGQRLQEAVEWEGGWGQGLSPQGVEVHGQRPPVRGIAQHQTEPTRPCVPLPPAQSPAVSLGRVTSKAGPGDSRGACRPAGPLAAACPPVDVHAAWLPQKRTHDGLPPAPEGPLSPGSLPEVQTPSTRRFAHGRLRPPDGRLL